MCAPPWTSIANWRRVQADLEETLGAVIDINLQDGFEFKIGDASPLEGEGPEGALRYTVTARLAGKIFEQLKLDVNLTSEDPRPVEIVEVKRNPFALIGERPLKAADNFACPAARREVTRLHAPVCGRLKLSPERPIRHARHRTGSCRGPAGLHPPVDKRLR